MEQKHLKYSQEKKNMEIYTSIPGQLGVWLRWSDMIKSPRPATKVTF